MRRNTLSGAALFLGGMATGASMLNAFGQTALAGAPSVKASPVADAGSGREVGARGRTTGIGGVFFKAEDPKALTAWYASNLGFPPSRYGVQFVWHPADEPQRLASTSWAAFPQTTRYFDPTVATFMINYRVDDLDAVLKNLRAAGAKVDDKVDAASYGRFGHAVDPEGNRFELWEPAPGK